jgi:hypothetical protein
MARYMIERGARIYSERKTDKTPLNAPWPKGGAADKQKVAAPPFVAVPVA